VRFFLAPLHILIENSAEEFARNGSRVGPHMMFSAGTRKTMGKIQLYGSKIRSLLLYGCCAESTMSCLSLCNIQTDRQTEPEQEGEIKK